MTGNAETAQTEHKWGFERELDQKTILEKWDLSVIKEHVKLIWAAMHPEEERGPTDYPPFEDERKILINIIRRQNERGGSHYNNGGGAISKVALSVIGALIIAGIISSVAMFARLAVVETNQVNQQRQMDALTNAVSNLRRQP